MQDLITAQHMLKADDFELADLEIREIFVEEVIEVLENMDNNLPTWSLSPSDFTPLIEIRRGFHTIKGSGRMIGGNHVGEMAWAVENLLNRVLDNTIQVSDELIQLVHQAKAFVPVLVNDFVNLRPPSIDPAIILLKADNLRRGYDVEIGFNDDSKINFIPTETTISMPDSDTLPDIRDNNIDVVTETAAQPSPSVNVSSPTISTIPSPTIPSPTISTPNIPIDTLDTPLTHTSDGGSEDVNSEDISSENISGESVDSDTTSHTDTDHISHGTGADTPVNHSIVDIIDNTMHETDDNSIDDKIHQPSIVSPSNSDASTTSTHLAHNLPTHESSAHDLPIQDLPMHDAHLENNDFENNGFENNDLENSHSEDSDSHNRADNHNAQTAQPTKELAETPVEQINKHTSSTDNDLGALTEPSVNPSAVDVHAHHIPQHNNDNIAVHNDTLKNDVDTHQATQQPTLPKSTPEIIEPSTQDKFISSESFMFLSLLFIGLLVGAIGLWLIF